MSADTNEGESIIQSPEITSTVPSPIYIRRSNYFNVHQRRPLRPSLQPVLWNPNQENIHSRLLVNYIPSSLNPVNNGNVVTCIKCYVNGYYYCFALD
jgi:hypothetical protein